MELTPEEKRKIYETEKARLEAEAEIKSEERDRKTRGCFGCIGIFILVFVVMAILGNLHSKSEKAKGPPPSDPALLSQCRELIQNGMSTGILSEATTEGDHTRVVVGPAFYMIDFKAKEGFCRAISYLAKSEGADGDFIIRDSRSNRQVGSFVTGILSLDD